MYSPMRKRHAMLDLETAATDTNAAILSIGILLFDPYEDNRQDIGRHIVVPFELNKGRTVDLKTVKWWMEQGPEAQHAAWIAERNSASFLDTLPSTLDSVDHIWANDPDFDCDVLKSFMEQHGIEWKWYRKHRSLRTIKAMFDIPFVEPIGNTHNALDDCKYQAEQVRAVIQGKAWPVYVKPYAGFGVDMGRDERQTPEPEAAATQPVMEELPPRTVGEALKDLEGRVVAMNPALGMGYGADGTDAK